MKLILELESGDVGPNTLNEICGPSALTHIMYCSNLMGDFRSDLNIPPPILTVTGGEFESAGLACMSLDDKQIKELKLGSARPLYMYKPSLSQDPSLEPSPCHLKEDICYLEPSLRH